MGLRKVTRNIDQYIYVHVCNRTLFKTRQRSRLLNAFAANPIFASYDTLCTLTNDSRTMSVFVFRTFRNKTRKNVS